MFKFACECFYVIQKTLDDGTQSCREEPNCAQVAIELQPQPART